MNDMAEWERFHHPEAMRVIEGRGEVKDLCYDSFLHIKYIFV